MSATESSLPDASQGVAGALAIEDGTSQDHLDEARSRARKALAGETHLGGVDDWRRILTSARDTLILLWIFWIVLSGLGGWPASQADAPGVWTFPLIALVLPLAILFGISTARATYAQVQYFAGELERERFEIEHHLEDEIEEVRALYEAKGFREPVLSQVVDTLASDEDRLLKVMMEEELGLSMHHVHHPLLVGLWNFGGSFAAGLALAGPPLLLPPIYRFYWMPVAGAVLLLAVSIISARATRRRAIEFFTVGMVTAVVTGGAALFLSRWIRAAGMAWLGDGGSSGGPA